MRTRMLLPLRTTLLCFAFAMSTIALGQAVAPPGNSPPSNAPLVTPPDAATRQAPAAINAVPLNQFPLDDEYHRALTACDDRRVDEQQACREAVDRQYGAAPQGDNADQVTESK
jgi:hypothetical protein